MSVSLHKPPTVAGDSMSGATELVGTVGQVRYRDPDNGFSILVLGSRATVKLEDEAGEIEEGRSYKFLGRWTEHVKYGRSFQADVWAEDVPQYERSVVTYVSEHAKGFGTRRATELWKLYGKDAVATLRDDPARVARELDLSEEDTECAARGLRDVAASENSKLAVYRLLAGRGFPRKTTRVVIDRWGGRAAGIIQRDPLSLLVAGIYGCGFKRCDRLYQDLGHPPDKLKRQALAAWAAVRAGSDGSTWILAEHAEDELVKLIGPLADPSRAVRLAVRAGRLAERASTEGTIGRYLADGAAARDERSLAERINRLAGGAVKWPDLADDPILTVRQKAEIKKSFASPVGLLLGTPGTGKTLTAARAIAAVLAHAGRSAVAVCAPTGKAAVRIGASLVAAKVAGVEPMTIHKLLEFRPGGFARNAKNPLDARYVIVDEASMLDTSLACRLVEACAPGTHLLFVGDPYQLPPVGHGAPLRDLQVSGKPCGLLTKVLRNGGLITEGCRSIKDREPIRFCQTVDYAKGDNLRLVRADTPAEANEFLAAFLDRIRARHLEDHELPDAVWKTQVIVAANTRSDLSRKAVNNRLQNQLNPDGLKAPGVAFRVGDKVICLQNGWYAPAELDPRLKKVVILSGNADDWKPGRDMSGGKRPDVYVANGESGECLAVAAGAAVFRFEDPGRTVKIYVGADKTDDEEEGDESPARQGRGCNFDLAYGITCHKSQGSEWPVVVVLADAQAGRVASQEWWYTAISRARRLCLVIGKYDTIDRQVRRRTLHVRKTFLKELLRGDG